MVGSDARFALVVDEVWLVCCGVVQAIKKGPVQDPVRTARIVGSRQLPPAMRQGTTIIRRLETLLRMTWSFEFETCADHSGQKREVKACRPDHADIEG
jgi:hypothetical protein